MTTNYIRCRSEYKHQLASEYGMEIPIPPPQNIQTEFIDLTVAGSLSDLVHVDRSRGFKMRVFAAAVFFAFVFSSCSSAEDEIVGTWRWESAQGKPNGIVTTYFEDGLFSESRRGSSYGGSWKIDNDRLVVETMGQMLIFEVMPAGNDRLSLRGVPNGRVIQARRVPKLPAGTRSTKPSDDQVEKAIREAVKRKGVPVSWVGNLLGCRGAEISRVEVVQVGSYSDQLRHWPMKIRVSGSCQLKDALKFGEVRAFDNVGEFVLAMDDYGTWKAALRDGTLQ